jgi:hypothetical protein
MTPLNTMVRLPPLLKLLANVVLMPADGVAASARVTWAV